MKILTESLDLVIHDIYLFILFTFIIFDIITGTLKAFKNNTVNSEINKIGLARHTSILLFCIFFSWVFYVANVGEFAKVLIIFYIVSYGLSIFENMDEMGVPLPQWLRNKFKLLEEETNKGGGIDEIKRT